MTPPQILTTVAAPPAAPPGTLEVVLDNTGNHTADAGSPTTTFVRIGLWNNAFDVSGNIVKSATEANDFVGGDSRRFYFRVRDAAAQGRGKLSINWRTLHPDGSVQDAPASQALTLIERGANSGVFTSNAVMLVNDDDDQSVSTNAGNLPGDPDSGTVRSRGSSNCRIRRAGMFAQVQAEYTRAGAAPVNATIPVFQRSPNERRLIPLQVFILRSSAGGTPVIANLNTLWSTDLRIITQTYERLGIWVWTTIAPAAPGAAAVPPADIVSGGSPVAYTARLIDPPAGMNAANLTSADESLLGTLYPAMPDTLRLFYVGGLASGNGGETWSDAIASATDARRGASFVILATGPYAAAHELGHSLTNRRAFGDGHFTAPTAPAGNRLQNNQNLMRREFLGAESVNGSKRLWDAEDQASPGQIGVNQYAAIRASHYTRPSP